MSGRYFTARQLRQLTARLSPRDEAVLKTVSDLRFVSGAQLSRWHYWQTPDAAANARIARRALLRLVRLGALARLPRPVGGVRAGSAGFVYYLTIGGQRLAIERGWQRAHRARQVREPGQLFVRHALAVAELQLQLVEGDRAGRFELLELAAEPSCWRSNDGLGSQPIRLKPDSYARLGLGSYEDSYFFEIDRGTEGSRAIENQLDAYVSYWQSGREQAEHGVFPSVLWLAETAQRVDVIRAVVASQPAAARNLFAVELFEHVLDVVAGPAQSEVNGGQAGLNGLPRRITEVVGREASNGHIQDANN